MEKVNWEKDRDQLFDEHEFEASKMATSINGGNWNKHYTEFQKRGWILNVIWAKQNINN